MSITFLDSEFTANTSSTNNCTIDAPAVADGSLLIAFVGLINTNVITAPSGWDTIGTAASSSTRLSAYSRIASSESGTYAWTFSGIKNCGIILAYGGIDSEATIISSSTTNSSSTTSHPTAAVNVPSDGWLISCGLGRHAFASPATTWTTNDGSDFERLDTGSASASGFDIAFAVYDSDRPISGSSSRTLTTSRNESQSSTWSIAITPLVVESGIKYKLGLGI